MKILFVEDSARIIEPALSELRRSGHAVTLTGGVGAANEALSLHEFDLAVVDIGLPDGSGLDWCRHIRQNGIDLPILLLTARSAIADRVLGLDAGADDYLGKPFAIAELVARVRALGRRGPRWTGSVRAFGRVVIDQDRRTVSVDGAPLALTPREFQIVSLLAMRQGRIVARDEILESVWGDASERGAASLDVLVARIRRKLEKAGVRDALRTVRQVGYAWALDLSKPN